MDAIPVDAHPVEPEAPRAPFTVVIDASTIHPDVLRALLSGQPLESMRAPEPPSLVNAFLWGFAKGCLVAACWYGAVWMGAKAVTALRAAGAPR